MLCTIVLNIITKHYSINITYVYSTICNLTYKTHDKFVVEIYDFVPLFGRESLFNSKFSPAYC